MSDLPFGGKYQPLEAVGKNVLLEIIKEAREKVTSSGIHLVTERNDPIIRARVHNVGGGVSAPIHEGDYVELAVQMFPTINDELGISRFQIVHEDMIIGVYKAK